MTDAWELRGRMESRRARTSSARSRRSQPRVVAAAAAVASAITLSLTACAAADGGSSPVARTAISSPAASSPSGAPDALPDYYSETTAARAPAYNNPDNITIRNTDTAAVLATVRPPSPYQTFGSVFAGSRPDTWVAAAQPWHPVHLDNTGQPDTLFTLTFDPATRRVALARLPAAPVTDRDLAAVALSPDGSSLAEVVLEPGQPSRADGTSVPPGVVQLRVYTTAGTTVTESSRELAATDNLSLAGEYSLTWLNDSKTLAIGGHLGSIDTLTSPQSVLYLNTDLTTGAPGAERTVALSFPPAGKSSDDTVTPTPDACSGPPIATSDGQHIVCGGTAGTMTNFAGAVNVGIWAFSALTGKLTAHLDMHGICCLLMSTMYPRVIWASTAGDILIATGITQANQGANLYVHASDGQFRQIPWRGLISYPDLGNIVEPAIAW
jgi:hypothetical protein